MSESFFDDLARTLARPMPRQRAVRLLGVALVTAAVPALRPRGAEAHQTACPDEKTCTDPGVTYTCRCPHPNGSGCVSTNCCASAAQCVCDEQVPNKGAACCGAGYVVKVTKKGAPDEGPLGTCVRCPGARLCGTQCCPVGQKCTWRGKKRVCCEEKRIVVKNGNRFCCLLGTVAVDKRSACCPALAKDCCGEDLAPLVGPNPLDNPRTFCVRGKAVKL